MLRSVLPAFFITLSLSAVARGQPAAATCRDAQECRQLALDAATSGEYERFHDLAWRAVQTGPRNDPGLMYILARAQVLSGRPHDALVMLKRLADMGVATDAPTNADFARTRDLPGWPEVADAIARAAAAPGSPAPATTAVATPGKPPVSTTSPAPRAAAADSINTPAADAVPAAVPLPVELAPTNEAGQFTATTFRSAGLAYDSVSRRFVIGDALGRKLIVVGVGSGNANDMVRADSAGFGDIVALEIDEKRGDLWVVSGGGEEGASGLHRLQLVSGRPLKTFRAAPSMGPTRLTALAVQASGTILALDSAAGRLVELATGSSDITVVMPLKLSGAASLAAGENGIVYIAHDAGIARVDLRTKVLAAVSAPKGLDLRGFETIRAHRNALIGLQTTAAGPKQLVRLELDAAGRAVRRAVVIDPHATEKDDRLSLSISADDLYYLATAPSSPENSVTRFIVRRLTLR
jgi:hypothetical protein